MRTPLLPTAVLCILAASSASASAEQIRRSVINNFGLIAGAEAQARFKSESDSYIACMRRRFSPGQCDNGRETFGLTQQPYPVHFDTKAFKYDSSVLHPVSPESGDTPDHVTIGLTLPGAKAQDRCQWTVGGKDVRATACKDANAAVPLDQDVAVAVSVRGKAGRSAEATVRVRRVVIANFGDSFMSGEGNPHMRSKVQPVKSENWLEPRCHRSLMTSSALAAFWYAEANPQAYVAYFNFACSGSTGKSGVLGDYEGIISSRMLDNLRGDGEEAIHFRGKIMPPQVAQAREVLCRKGQCTAPDAVFLSIGINTIGFGKVVTELGKPNCGAPCLERLQADVNVSLEELKGDSNNGVVTALTRIKSELTPKAAFAVEYPDPTRDENGNFCKGNVLFPMLGKLGIGRVDASENQWAIENVLDPLNAAVTEAAARTNWQMVTGTIEATRKGGFCSTQRLFNSGQDAKGTSGTLHPNAAGHNAIAQLMLAKLNVAIKPTP